MRMTSGVASRALDLYAYSERDIRFSEQAWLKLALFRARSSSISSRLREGLRAFLTVRLGAWPYRVTVLPPAF